jgi:hypothetical protein
MTDVPLNEEFPPLLLAAPPVPTTTLYVVPGVTGTVLLA